MSLSYGSVCSGIEAVAVAWDEFGWRATWFAEIDKAASKVLARHWPHVTNLGDMTLLAARIRAGEIEAPDILVGGTPCQSFSLAGLRGGFSDARGQLTLAFVDLANAIDERRAELDQPPCVVIWENVPGVLSHADNPLGCFLAGLGGDADPIEPGPKPADGASSPRWTWSKKLHRHVPKWTVAGLLLGPERTAAWRTLDAQYFRLAQRRRRVFVVASAREGFDPGEVLPEFDGLRRDSPPSREAGKDAPGSTTASPDHQGDDSRWASAGWATAVDQQSRGRPNRLAAFGGGKNCNPTDVSVAVTGSQGGSQGGRYDVDTETFIVHSVALRGRDGGATAELGGEQAGTLRASAGGGDKPYVLAPLPFDTTQITSKTNRNSPEHGDPCHPLAATAHPPAIAYRTASNGEVFESGDHVAALTTQSDPCSHIIAFSCKDYGADAQNELAPTLRAMNHATSHANAGGQVAVCVTGDITHALKADGFDGSEDGSGRGQLITVTRMAVRRLMPVECERLQGFPDGHTEGQADGPRYKQIGNSMAVEVMRWIGARVGAEIARSGHSVPYDRLMLILLAAIID